MPSWRETYTPSCSLQKRQTPKFSLCSRPSVDSVSQTRAWSGHSLGVREDALLFLARALLPPETTTCALRWRSCSTSFLVHSLSESSASLSEQRKMNGQQLKHCAC